VNSIVSAIVAAILSLIGVQQPTSAAAAPPVLAAAAATSIEPALPATQHVITYTVQAGDTLSGIAQSFSIPLSDLLAANDLSERAILHPGEQLIIPNPQTAPDATYDQTTLSENVKSAELIQTTSHQPQSNTSQPATSLLPEPAFDTSNFVTRDQFNAAMAVLGSSVQQLLAVSRSIPLPQYVAADGNPIVPYAAENNISNLSNVTITNANLTAAGIPALNYFPSTSTISIAYGGTGLSNSPTFGQLLLGNGSGGYSLVSTSSLGIVAGGGGGGNSNVSTSSQNTWSALQIFGAGASMTQLSVFNSAGFGSTATSTFNSAGKLSLVPNGLTVGTNQLVVSSNTVGIGTTTPWSDIANASSLLDLTTNGTVRITLHDTGSTQEEKLSSDGTGFYIDSAGGALGSNINIVFRVAAGTRSPGSSSSSTNPRDCPRHGRFCCVPTTSGATAIDTRISRVKDLIAKREGIDAELSTILGITPKVRKTQRCSICNEEGHTARTCPQPQQAA
jgi:LysM repeat protein